MELLPVSVVLCLSITSDKVESSTYLRRFTSPITSMSFIITKNSQRQSLVPCGTPAGTVFHSEKQSSPSLTLCLRSVMKSSIQSRVVLGISYFARFFSKVLWSFKSKAFRKSNRIIRLVELLACVLLFQECNILIKVYVVLEFGMALNWFSSILANIAGFKCCSTTNSSATLGKMGASDIGRKWSFISVIGLFFVMGRG